MPSTTSPWILDARRDALLVWGTPLLVVPAFALMLGHWSVTTLAVYVAAFGAMGHHLPGLLRVYGTRALFDRFKLRFMLAPTIFLGGSLLCAWNGLRTVEIVLLGWGVWHASMQTYGFMRIYAAKAGPGSRDTSSLDFLACNAWFVAGVLNSPARTGIFVGAFDHYAGTVIPPGAVALLGQISLAVAMAPSLLIVLHALGQSRRGPSLYPWVRVLLLGTSAAFWWFTMVGLNHVVLGLALWEVFHDIQYLTIVWVISSKMRTTGRSKMVAAIVSRRKALAVMYVGAVLLYGSIGMLPWKIEAQGLRVFILAVVSASTLLHFYYDGFIWKVREAPLRRALRASPPGSDRVSGSSSAFARYSVPHGLKCGLAGMLILVAMGVEWRSPREPVAHRARVVESVPDSYLARWEFGLSLRAAGNLVAARGEFVEALRLRPAFPEAMAELAETLTFLGHADQALPLAWQAVLQEPAQAGTHRSLSVVHESLGNLDGALSAQVSVVERDSSPANLTRYARLLQAAGRSGDAAAALQEASRMAPMDTAARR